MRSAETRSQAKRGNQNGETVAEERLPGRHGAIWTDNAVAARIVNGARR